VEVRRATVEDCDALGRAMKVVVDEDQWMTTQSDTSADELADRFRRACTDDGHRLFVLEDRAALIGGLGLHPTDAPGVLTFGMFVLPEWRGQGGGRMLIEHALRDRPPGTHKVELEVFPENEPAVALYRSMGFEDEGLRRKHFRRLDGSLRSSLIMARLFWSASARK
jgi:RimJ/RimL family protein N-acetyltransferase